MWSGQVGAPTSTRAGAARRPDADEAVAEPALRAEHIGLQQRDIVEVALRAEVGLARLRLEQDLFGRLHGAHHRRRAPRVAIDADTEVDLARPLVVAERLDPREQGVGGLGVQGFEHRTLSLDKASPVSNRRRPHGRVANGLVAPTDFTKSIGTVVDSSGVRAHA